MRGLGSFAKPDSVPARNRWRWREAAAADRRSTNWRARREGGAGGARSKPRSTRRLAMKNGTLKGVAIAGALATLMAPAVAFAGKSKATKGVQRRRQLNVVEA